MILQAKDIRKKINDLEILKGIHLEVKKGEIVAIVGSSGAGKTTLLHILGTLEPPTSGEILIQNQKIKNLSPKELAKFRNETIGFVFQFHHLLAEFTALENVSMPAWIQQKENAKIQERAEELLDLVHLLPRKNHLPSQLSGGEQQRVAVARALMNKPSVIFADEPSGNLDSKNATELHQLFFELREKYGQTFIIVTHNKELAEMADRIVTIKDGLLT